MLQRDVEGDGIAEVPQEAASSHRSTPVVPRAVEVEGIAPRRPRRLVLVQGSHEEVETAVDEEGSVVSTSGEGVFETIREPDIEMPEVRDSSAAIREGSRHLDAENVSMLFETRATVLKTVPHFLKGPVSHRDEDCTHGGKLRGRVPSRQREETVFASAQGAPFPKATRRFDQSREIDQPFLSVVPREVGRIDQSERARCRGSIHGQVPPIKASKCRRRKTGSARAQMLVQLGELSSGRQALEAAAVAPGTLQTLQALRDPSRRPRRFEPATSLELDEGLFSKKLRSTRRGAAAGPPGMTTDHLRPLLDNVRDLHLLFSVREQLATGMAPQEVVEIGRMGRLTALKKPNGSEASCLVKCFAGWCRGPSPSKSAKRLKQAPLRFNALCPPKLAASA